MKTTTSILDRNIKRAKIYVFSDWHIGDAFCNIADIKREIDAAKEDENAFIICNGDLVNNATKTSISDCYAEEMSPMEQIEMLVALLDPVKDKILMLTQGNHESRTYKTEGIDLTAIVAKQLGLSDKYVREGGVLFLQVGQDGKHKPKQLVYTFYVTHGTGGGRKEGAKAIRLADLAGIVDTDIYIHGHTHLPMIMKESFYRTNYRNRSICQTEKLFVNTSAKLEYGGYGQRCGFKPSSISNPVIYIDGTKKRFTAKL